MPPIEPVGWLLAADEDEAPPARGVRDVVANWSSKSLRSAGREDGYLARCGIPGWAGATVSTNHHPGRSGRFRGRRAGPHCKRPGY